MTIFDVEVSFGSAGAKGAGSQPADLQTVLGACGVTGAVAVATQPSLARTERLLELAEANDCIRGIVGWLPAGAAGFDGLLARPDARAWLRGMRVKVGGGGRNAAAASAELDDMVRHISRASLLCEMVVMENALPRATGLVERHPTQMFVLANLGQPNVQKNELEPWRAQLRELARRPNVVAKIDGLITAVNPDDWDEARLWPFFDTAVDAFSPQRLMFSSDWPLLLESTTYVAWLETVTMWIDVLTGADQARVLGGTAAEVYRI